MTASRIALALLTWVFAPLAYAAADRCTVAVTLPHVAVVADGGPVAPGDVVGSAQRLAAEGRLGEAREVLLPALAAGVLEAGGVALGWSLVALAHALDGDTEGAVAAADRTRSTLRAD